MKQVTMVISGSGGCGKTTIVKAIAELHAINSEPLLVIDTDETNANVFDYFDQTNEHENCKNKVDCKFINLKNDFAMLADILESDKIEVDNILFNFGAGTNVKFEEASSILVEALKNVDCKIKVVFVVGRDVGQPKLFCHAFENMPFAEFIVCKNEFFGTGEDIFYAFDKHENAQEIILKNQIKIIRFPNMHDSVGIVSHDEKIAVGDISNFSGKIKSTTRSRASRFMMDAEKCLREAGVLHYE